MPRKKSEFKRLTQKKSSAETQKEKTKHEIKICLKN